MTTIAVMTKARLQMEHRKVQARAHATCLAARPPAARPDRPVSRASADQHKQRARSASVVLPSRRMSVDDAAGSLQSKLSRQRTGSLSVAMENRVSRRLSIGGSPLFSENFRRPSFAVRRPSLLGLAPQSAAGRRPSVEPGTGLAPPGVTFQKAAVGPEQAEDERRGRAAAAPAVPEGSARLGLLAARVCK